VADVNSITFTTAGGSQMISNSTVTQMTRMADAFYVEGEGSTLSLENVNMVRNQIQADSWSAVAARAGAIAQILNVTIAENTGVEFGIVSFSSMVTVQDTILRQNTGSVRRVTFYVHCFYFLICLTQSFPMISGICGYAQCTNLCNHRCSNDNQSSAIY
jgi:hypothetical protein